MRTVNAEACRANGSLRRCRWRPGRDWLGRFDWNRQSKTAKATIKASILPSFRGHLIGVSEARPHPVLESRLLLIQVILCIKHRPRSRALGILEAPPHEHKREIFKISSHALVSLPGPISKQPANVANGKSMAKRGSQRFLSCRWDCPSAFLGPAPCTQKFDNSHVRFPPNGFISVLRPFSRKSPFVHELGHPTCGRIALASLRSLA